MDRAIPLATKLARPRTARFHLPRPHLSALLQDGLSRRLTVLLATAGHGKTSTLAHFLDGVQLPVLWIQLDPRDSDLHTFLRYLSLGVKQELGGGSQLWAALEAGAQDQDPVTLLVEDLQACPHHHVIVLDDFHLITKESEVGAFMARLLQYIDTQTHFYICSRTTLPFSTARLKVIQEAAEITEDDLRFSRKEIEEFFDAMTGSRPSEERLEQVCHLTEGWSAALVLLASAARRRGGLDGLLSGGLPNDLFAYLADEVFQGLSRNLQSFMEESSILDLLSPAMCDDVLGRQDSGALLSQLYGSNLLVMQVGPDTYRYHHLLQRFLQERLKARESGDFARLNKLAGQWFLSREEPEEAVKYYLRGGWIQEAAGLTESLAPLWLRTHRLDRLRGLLAQIPQNLKEQYPWITLCEARNLLNVGKADHAVGMAQLALRGFEEVGDSRGAVQAHVLLGECFAIRQQYASAEAEFSLAANAIKPEYRHEEALLLRCRAGLAYMSDRAPETVEEDLRRSLAIYVELGDLPGEAAVSDLLGVIRAQRGDYTTAIQLLERSTDLLRSLGEPPYEVGINLAWVYLDVARFRDAAAICEPMMASSNRKLRRVYAGVHLLQAYTRQGEFAKAAAIAPITNALIEELGNPELKTGWTAILSALYRLAGKSQASIPFANEALHLAREGDRSHLQIEPLSEVVLLHLFYTGNTGKAAQIAEKAMSRLEKKATVLQRVILTLALAVARFRLTRTESRPEAVRVLQDGLTECQRRGADFFALHEWQLALAVIIYGLAYDVQAEYCCELIETMTAHLPRNVLEEGILLSETESRLLPAAWQALPNEELRNTFATLLAPKDRKRVVTLATGPAPLVVNVLGPLVVTIGETPIDVKALKRRKSGQLLTLLVSSEGPLPREQVIDRLWPDLDLGAADTSLRVSLHHLRRILEPYLGGKAKSRYIQAEGGLVWFSRQPEVQVDLDEFREEMRLGDLAQQSGNLREAAQHFEAACRLYQGDLLADDPYCLEDLREAWRSQFTGALDWLGEYYWHEAGSASKAINAFHRRLSVDETFEAAHQSLMRIYLETGQIDRARQQYLACREALKAQLGVEPSPTTESLLQLAVSMENEAKPTR